MGEISEMMIDGTLCEGCGVFIGEAVGFPRLCADCAKDRKADGHMVRDTGMGGFQDIGPVKCATCGRKVKPAGLRDHMRDAHGIAP